MDSGATLGASGDGGTLIGLPLIEAAAYCQSRGLSRVLFVLVHKPSEIELAHLKAKHKETAVVRQSDFLGLHAALANRLDAVVFVGHLDRVEMSLIRAMLRSAHHRLICRGPAGWNAVPVFRLMLGLTLDRLRQHLTQLSDRHWLAVLARRLRSIGFLRRVWHDSLLQVTSHKWQPSANWVADKLLELRRGASADADIAARSGVVIVAPDLAAGGAERQMLNVATGFVRRGIAVTVVSERRLDRPERCFFSEALRQGGVRVLELGDGPVAPPAPLVEFPTGLGGKIARLMALLHDLRPLAVHAWQDEAALLAAIAALGSGVPRCVVAWRNVAPCHFPDCPAWLAPCFMALSGQPGIYFTANSKAGADSYATWLGWSPSRIAVVRNGLDIDAVLRAAARQVAPPFPDNPCVGGIFRLSEEKRPLLWLSVAARVAASSPEVRFVVIGTGRLRNTFLEEVQRLGLSDRLILIEPTNDALAHMASWRLTLLTSSVEGTPNVLLEAQALGIPIVATAVGGTPEAVAALSSNVLVSEAGSIDDTASALAAAVMHILRDSDSAASDRSAGRLFVAEHFGQAAAQASWQSLLALSDSTG